MNRAEVKFLNSLADKAVKLSGQYKAIQNPAYISFEEIAIDLRDFASKKEAIVNEGDVTNLTVLREQCRLKCIQNSVELIQFDIDYKDIKPRFSLGFRRATKKSDSWGGDRETTYSNSLNEVIPALNKLIQDYKNELKEAQVEEVVINNEEEKEEEEGGES